MFLCSYTHTEYASSGLKWFLHHKQSQEPETIGDLCRDGDNVREGQIWSSNMEDWAAFSKKAQMMDRSLAQSCDSPLASDSSSSVSPVESSFFCANSENSHTSAKHVCQSPELLSSRFSGFSLFNSGINHLEAMIKEEDSSGEVMSRDEQKQCIQKHDLRHGFFSNHKALKVHEEDINADALTCSNFVASERLCCAAPHQPCTVVFAPTTYQMHLIQDFGPMASNSEIHVLHERYESSKAHSFQRYESPKGHSLEGLHERYESSKGHSLAKYESPKGHSLECLHGLPEHKTKISQHDSAMVDRKAEIQPDSQLPTSSNTITSTSLQSEDVRKPSLYTKSRYSAAVKERFASSTLHGYLRFVEQGGSPCYSFFVDDSDEVLFARACQEGRGSNKENCDWMYSFHSKKDNGKAKGAWKGWAQKERMASDLVASMKIPSVCKAKKNHSKEAHFVLYDTREQQHVENPASGSEKPQSWPLKPVFDNMLPSQVGHAKQRVLKISGTNDCASNDTLKKGSTNASGACAERLNICINQQAELAAIVISTSAKEKKMTKRKESKPPLAETDGWGVKFLDKSTESGWGLSLREKASNDAVRGLSEMPSCAVTANRGGQLECIAGGACQSNIADLPNGIASCTSTYPDLTQKPGKRLSSRKSRLKVDVTVILPAGDHGWPVEDEKDVGDGGFSHGPSPLLDRWASGGECECGGWDMGCGLSVFKAETLTLHKRPANIALTRYERVNWLSPGHPLKVFSQGYKQKKVLVLEMIEAGLFSMSFHARISPLQAFSIAVALFHQQMAHK